MSQTAWLVDGTAYVFRSYYSMRPISAPDGTPVNAVFGLGMTLQRFLQDESPSHLAVVFDAGRLTFRNELYPEYKANRGEPPEDLAVQFELCPALTKAMGIATFLKKGFEADDLLASMASRLLEQGFQVKVVTGDKDLSQILRPGLEIYDLAKGRKFGAEEVPHLLGVRSDQVVDLLALMGDSSDNIPGVRGVGKKSAIALLAAFGDLDAIYERLDEVEGLAVRGAKSLRRKLEQDRDKAYLSRKLARLRQDIPLSFEPSGLRYLGAERKALDKFAERWGLRRVAARVPQR
jgi:DNA polymerase-1